MPTDIQQVKAELMPEEPDYPRAAKKLGPEALPHLEEIIGGPDPMLAAKAAYLAGVIGGTKSAAAVEKAARSSHVTLRVAAAAAAAHLPPDRCEAVLAQLVDDVDAGVQKVAAQSVPDSASDSLRSRASAVRTAMAPAGARATKSRKTKKKT